MKIFSIVLGIGLLAGAASREPAKPAPLRLLLSEVQPGSLASEQYCMLVFDDHRFHAETAHRSSGGRDQRRTVYEGQLSDGEWNALTAIVDSEKFRELRVPASTPALVIHEPHPYTISVARDKGFQNMEFLTKESLKPYEPEVKPLLRWWKSWRGTPMHEAEAPPDGRCSLTNENAVFSN
jgi:hypothetical protein